jgi:hypothetical protein
MDPIIRDCNPSRKNMIPITSFPSLKALGRNYSQLVDTDFGFFFVFLHGLPLNLQHNEPFYSSSELSVDCHSSGLVFAYSGLRSLDHLISIIRSPSGL